MGILDTISSTAGRGKAAAGRKAEQIRLNNQMNSLDRRRKGLAAQLGASLFDVVRASPQLLVGREGIVREMEAIDLQRAEIEARLTDLAAEAEAQPATTLRCVKCGAPIQAGDKFCGTCGAPAAEALSQQAPAPAPATATATATVTIGGPTCPTCGAPLEPGDAFCMSCGQPIPSDLAAGQVAVTVEVDGESATAVERICPHCGSPVEEGERFCSACGHRVE